KLRKLKAVYLSFFLLFRLTWDRVFIPNISDSITEEAKSKGSNPGTPGLKTVRRTQRIMTKFEMI
ncbi:MAG: hypothetical protein KAI35_08700, partial [Desulfobulbaceae bacterium]|nr:hypothetical protein [Desulfobulbaceae bacterium]